MLGMLPTAHVRTAIRRGEPAAGGGQGMLLSAPGADAADWTPGAQTCDNVLELPNYWESLVAVHLAEEGREFEGEEALLADERRRLQRRLHALVAEKLRVAMSHGHGYGLDDVQPGQH